MSDSSNRLVVGGVTAVFSNYKPKFVLACVSMVYLVRQLRRLNETISTYSIIRKTVGSSSIIHHVQFAVQTIDQYKDSY